MAIKLELQLGKKYISEDVEINGDIKAVVGISMEDYEKYSDGDLAGQDLVDFIRGAVTSDTSLSLDDKLLILDKTMEETRKRKQREASLVAKGKK